MVWHLRNPSFSERISRGHQSVLMVEDRFREALRDGEFKDENQTVLGREVVCEYGRVDLLLTDWVVEFKTADQWKSGVGQLLVYGACWPEKGMWMHIYTARVINKTNLFMNKIDFMCDKLGIRVTYDTGAPVEHFF